MEHVQLKILIQTFAFLGMRVKETLANLDSARLRSFAALHIAASAGVERLSAKDIADCLEAAGVALHESEVRDALEKAVREDCVTVKRDESRALVYKLMTKGKKAIEPLLGSAGMSIVLIDRDQPRTDRRRLRDTETITHPCIVLAFDLCSSSKIMEDLLLNDKFRDYKAFLTCIKRWLIDRAKKQPPTNDCFELYKFTGDGWILLFPTTIVVKCFSSSCVAFAKWLAPNSPDTSCQTLAASRPFSALRSESREVVWSR